jgi:hypothetical protein
METLFHGTNVILIALVNYYKKKDEGGEWWVGWGFNRQNFRDVFN